VLPDWLTTIPEPPLLLAVLAWIWTPTTSVR
jgi:hypothetical protein